MSSPPPGFERRHVVWVEDHLYHTAEMLEAVARASPEMLAWTTACVIEDSGADTTAAISTWLNEYPGIQIAARIEPRDVTAEHAGRLLSIRPSQLEQLPAFARMVASLLLPGGVLVQDVHLSTARFVPPDRWWESIYAAATVRGMFARQPPAVRFVSNKRGYAATFGRDLMDAGFDPREVMDKSELEQVILPAVARDVDGRFPLELTTTQRAPVPFPSDEESRVELEQRLDLVDWDVSGRVELGGRLLAAPVIFRTGSNEALTWQRLIAERLNGGSGVLVTDVGQRLAEAGADRAEISNLAARHIHSLRARPTNSAAIVTANHAYRLDSSVAVGRVRRRHLHQPPGSSGRNLDPVE